MKFSVVIPLYNKAECIKQTIDTVLAQTETDFEVVVVDDGSTDESAAIVKSINDSRIRLIQQNNQGVSVARNNGISNTRGEIVAFLDADDIWLPDFLETVDKLFMEFPEADVACPDYQVSYGNRMVKPVWKGVDNNTDCLVSDFFEMATGSFWITHSSTTAVKKSALMKMDHWFAIGETCYEDFDFWLRLCSKVKVAHSNKVCAIYNRMSPQNARQVHATKVVYSKAYMDTLDTFMHDCTLTDQQKFWVNEIKDRRMVPYIFSLLCLKRRDEAKRVLKAWNPLAGYKKYHQALSVMSALPFFAIDIIQKARYRIF